MCRSKPVRRNVLRDVAGPSEEPDRVAVQLASSEDEAPHLSGLKCADPPEEPRRSRSLRSPPGAAWSRCSEPGRPGAHRRPPAGEKRSGSHTRAFSSSGARPAGRRRGTAPSTPDLPQVRLRPPHRSPRPEAGPSLLQVREQVQVHDQHQRSPVHDELSVLRRPR